MKCLKCQFANPEGLKFCGECGAKLERVCPKCNCLNPPQFKFCGECGYKLTLPSEPTCGELSSDEKGVPEPESERKYVTAMFSDLSGYTAMSEKLDPEEVKEIVSRIFGEIAQVVTKYEGFVKERPVTIHRLKRLDNLVRMVKAVWFAQSYFDLSRISRAFPSRRYRSISNLISGTFNG